MAKIENLDQVRAINAFNACKNDCFRGKDGGEVVKKLPPMIRENGVLGALAFALNKKDRNAIGYAGAFTAITEHLKCLEKVKANNVEDLQTELLGCPSIKLRDVTAETMLYLNYLRRFAQKKEKKDNQQ